MSDQAIWTAVDDYIADKLLPDDPMLDAALKENAVAGLPAIDVSRAQGAFLALLVRISAARRVLEIGTLSGYSAIAMARVLPEDGELISLEAEPHHAETARANVARAGLADRVIIQVGRAADTLPKLSGPFDLVFIDADKPSNPIYLDWAVRLGRRGTIVVVDNVIREGGILNGNSRNESIAGSRAAFDALADERFEAATALQTVGAKGYDGFAIALLK